MSDPEEKEMKQSVWTKNTPVTITIGTAFGLIALGAMGAKWVSDRENQQEQLEMRVTANASKDKDQDKRIRLLEDAVLLLTELEKKESK